MGNYSKPFTIPISILIYYLVLLLIMLLRNNEQVPNLIIRYGFMIAFFVPLILKYRELYPSFLVCFMTVGLNSFAYSFFPYNTFFYFVISFVGLFFINKSNFVVTIANKWYIILLLLILSIDILDNGNPNNVFYSFIITSIFTFYIRGKEGNARFFMVNTFCVITFALSIIYFQNYDKFAQTYEFGQDLKRSTWTDTNYFSGIIGMGVLTSFIMLLKSNQFSVLLKMFWISTICIGFVTQLLLASRGGVLSIACAVFILLLFVKIKTRYKLLVFLFLISFIIWLYSNSYFELLEYRIQNDVGGGSGRTDIWITKLSAFFNQGNIITLLFGNGYYSGSLLGFNHLQGSHNEFVAVLCDYGFIGLAIFIYLLIYPIQIASKSNRTIVIPIIVYLIITCTTIEPLTLGGMTYFAFYFLAFLYAKKGNNFSAI